jgi:DnaJ-class molecular chaperone
VTPLAATATTDLGSSACLLLTLTFVTASYLFTCWIYPFTNCRRCHGTGKAPSLFGGRSFRLCRRCDGTGRQLRTGRHVLNYLRNLHDNGTKH